MRRRWGWRVRRLDRRTWLVQRAGRGGRRVHRIGPPTARTHIVGSPRAARRHARAVQQGLAEYAGAEHVAWMLRRLEINVVIDAGANRGQFATRLRRHGYRGRIVSFEPVAELARALQERAAADSDWLVYPYALGAEDGDGEINARPGAMSSLLPSSEFGRSWHANLRAADRQPIRIRRLDSVYPEAVAGIDRPRVFLKLDTQGFDLEAFAGAAGMIDAVLAMQSEVSLVPIYRGMPRLAEVLGVYEAAGFAVNGMFPVSFDMPSARVIEFDMVLIRHDSDANSAQSA